jgi:hypothetical protein
VNVVDVQLVANLWRCAAGDGCYNGYCDLDANGRIDVVDIMLVAAQWGECCS